MVKYEGIPFDSDPFAPWGFAVGTNRRENAITKVIVGRNDDVDTTLAEDLWAVGGDYNWMTQAQVINVVSDNAADDVGGSGAVSFFIGGLIDDWTYAFQILPLDGVTQVSTTTEFRRINDFYALGAGSGNDTNVGTITATAAVDGFTVAQIAPGRGSSMQAIYTVPEGWTFAGKKTWGGIANANNVQVTIFGYLRPFDEVNQKHFCWREVAPYSLSGFASLTFPGMSFPVPSKADLRLRAIASGNNTPVTGGFAGVLIRDGED